MTNRKGNGWAHGEGSGGGVSHGDRWVFTHKFLHSVNKRSENNSLLPNSVKFCLFMVLRTLRSSTGLCGSSGDQKRGVVCKEGRSTLHLCFRVLNYWKIIIMIMVAQKSVTSLILKGVISVDLDLDKVVQRQKYPNHTKEIGNILCWPFSLLSISSLTRESL